MVQLSRRHALLAMSAGIASLAGCTGGEDRLTIDAGRDERMVEDYELRAVRNENGAVLFAHGDELPTLSDDDRARTVRSARAVIVSEASLADVTFGDETEAAELRSFVEATDFDASSVYLFSTALEACYEIRIRSVAVDWDDRESGDIHPHADFCRTHRRADVACPLEAVHTYGAAIRLPVAASSSSGSGHGMSRSCRPTLRGEYFNASVTSRGQEE